MAEQDQSLVFISHTNSDRKYAIELESVLQGLKIPAWNYSTALKAGEHYVEQAKKPLESCTHAIVLIGPDTLESKWVDMEIEVITALRENAPRAQIICVVLPNHDDFKKPYYDPGKIPFRLHDLILREGAILKKWDSSPQAVSSWIDESRRRASSERSIRPSLEVLKFVRANTWTNRGDIAREGLSSLSAQHSDTT